MKVLRIASGQPLETDLCARIIEEESLERALGEPYRAYKQRVRGRIIPGLPF